MNRRSKPYRGRRNSENKADLILIAILIAFILIVAVLFPQHAAAVYKPRCNATDVMLPDIKPLGWHYITGYNPLSAAQCGKAPDSPNLGIGANGTRIIPGEHVAMSGVPFGTRIYIEGMGEFTVQDRGVGRGKVDVACETNAECYEITGIKQVYLID